MFWGFFSTAFSFPLSPPWDEIESATSTSANHLYEVGPSEWTYAIKAEWNKQYASAAGDKIEMQFYFETNEVDGSGYKYPVVKADPSVWVVFWPAGAPGPEQTNQLYPADLLITLKVDI
ncbi:MAG: hypothetical protein ACTSW4_03935 [Candidatus Ranarchaeia archaeon]